MQIMQSISEELHNVVLRKGILRALGALLIGLCAGAINGLLGAGGGIIAVLALGSWQRQQSEEQRSLRAKDVYVTSLCAMLPVSLLSAVQYAVKGHLQPSAFTPLLLPAILGGIVGGWILDRMRLPLLQRLFAVLLLISGVRMLL
jgi:uncharacterized membrane protein YfcA